MKYIVKKYPVISAGILIVLLVLVTFIPLNVSFGSVLIRIILCAILIFYLYKNGLLNILRFNPTGFVRGLISGILFFLFAIWVAVNNIIAFHSQFHVSIAFWDFCSRMLMIGILEEFCFRGLLLNVYIKHRGKVKSTIYRAVLLSSIVFGILHYMSLANQPFLKTTVQVFSSFCMGILFAAIYLKSLNIWVCVFLHALWDFGNMYGSFLPNHNVDMYGVAGEMSLSQAAFSMIEPSLFLIIGLFILRNIHKERYMTAIFSGILFAPKLYYG